MKYEKTPVKPTDSKKVTLHDMGRLSTPVILWYLIKRHKVGILGTWAVVMTALYVFPPLPHVLLSLAY